MEGYNMCNKVVQFKKMDRIRKGKMKMENTALLGRNIKIMRPTQLSRGIAMYLSKKDGKACIKCDGKLINDLFETGKQFKEVLGLSDSDVYSMFKK
jgi:hypothetical protein